jgi:hypothetical protein
MLRTQISPTKFNGRANLDYFFTKDKRKVQQKIHGWDYSSVGSKRAKLDSDRYKELQGNWVSNASDYGDTSGEGFKNTGNVCYVNTSIQASYTNPFLSLFSVSPRRCVCHCCSHRPAATFFSRAHTQPQLTSHVCECAHARTHVCM